MKNVLLIALLAFGLNAAGQTVWINEIHYDNAGADAGEGWEIAAPAGTDLSCYTIYLVNGSTGATYSTIVLSGIVPDNGCGTGTIWFNQAGIQNGAPDGIALYNNCTGTLVQFLSYEGSFNATSAPIAGAASTDIGVSESGATAVGESLQLSGGPGNTYGDFTWQTAGASTNGATNTGQDFCVVPCGGPGAEPTDPITGAGVTSLGCTAAELEWIIGSDADNVIVVLSSTGPISANPTDGVDYSVGDPLGGGNVVYQGDGSTVTVSGLTPGVTYFFSIFEYSGNTPDCDENYFITGTAIGSFTTTSPCASVPQINSINYNSCNGTSEGTDELIVFTTGDDAILIDSIELDLPNSMFCNSCTPSDGNLVNNAAHILALNTMAGCTMFQYCDPIPPNSIVMVFTGNPPTTVLDYSSNCGAPGAPFCAFFMDNTSTTGNFANYASTPRVLTINFGGGVSSTVSYTGTDGVCNCDGASVNYDANGNPTYVQNTDCIYPLSEKINTLSGYNKESSNVIEWSTYNDYTSETFNLLRSSDGINWTNIHQIPAERSMLISAQYEFQDWDIESSNGYYYKLEIIDEDGTKSKSNSIYIENNSITTFYQNNQISIGFNAHPAKAYTLNIYDLSGALVYQTPAQNGMQIPWAKNGFFILEIPELGIRKKLITN